MLNEQQFGKFKPNKPQGPAKPNKPQGPAKPKKPKVPGQSASSGSGGYKFLPIPKSQEEKDLMEAKARAINVKIRQTQSKG